MKLLKELQSKSIFKEGDLQERIKVCSDYVEQCERDLKSTQERLGLIQEKAIIACFAAYLACAYYGANKQEVGGEKDNMSGLAAPLVAAGAAHFTTPKKPRHTKASLATQVDSVLSQEGEKTLHIQGN